METGDSNLPSPISSLSFKRYPLKRSRLHPYHTLYLLPLLFLAVFYTYPLLSILRLSLAPAGQWNLAALGQVLAQPFLGQVLWFPLWQAVASTLLTLGLGLPAAYLFAHYTFPGKTLFLSLIHI